jgi:bifunctional UDP-N-acetylglucosamine pyrophosphorylase/glucosamine-1-phosphate N-acetyltransferase/UDP-N-acetylglucosamine pyrophosphorylase
MNQEVLAIVLAAGRGTRMNSELPKVLCQANGKPLVRYVIESLRAAGVGPVVAVVGYRSELVREELAEDVQIEFAEQTEQLGTGHAVMMCRAALARHSGPVVVVAGDSPMLQATSIRALLDEMSKSSAACILGTLMHDNPTGLGRIVRDESGKFTGIVEEKDATDQQRQIREVNMSTYVFDSAQLITGLDHLTNDNRQKEYYITDLPAIMLGQGLDVRALPVLQPIEALSVNTVEHLQAVETELRKIRKS